MCHEKWLKNPMSQIIYMWNRKTILKVIFIRFKWGNVVKISSITCGSILIKCHFHFQYLKYSYDLAMIIGSSLWECLASLATFKLYFYLPPWRYTVPMKASLLYSHILGKTIISKPDFWGTSHFLPVSGLWEANLKAELIWLTLNV